MVIGSWTCGGAISPYTSTFFKASISCVSGHCRPAILKDA
jgi:hypothetical protein